MRICFVTTGDYVSLPAMKRATGMAGPLLARGHQVGIVALDNATNRERLAADCPQAEALWFQAGGQFAEIRQKRALLRSWRPDWVYVCGFGLRNMTSLGRKPWQVVVEHCELGSATPSLGLARRQCERVFEYLSVLAADRLVLASHYLEGVYARRLGRVGRRRPTLYAPYAYPDSLRPKAPAAAAAPPLIVYLGALRRNYGVLDMIQAAGVLAGTRRDFRLQLLGKGSDELAARQLVQQLGIADLVDFAGYVAEEELPARLAAASVFLAPLYDTPQDWARCPSKLYLYLPFRKPIVTSPIGDARDLLGDDGFYFPPGDPAALAASLDRALAAAPVWQPRTLRPEAHSWEARTAQFLDWLANSASA